MADLLQENLWTPEEPEYFWEGAGFCALEPASDMYYTLAVNGAWANGLRPETITVSGAVLEDYSYTIRVYDTQGSQIGAVWGVSGIFSEEVSLTFDGYDIGKIEIGVDV